MGKKVIVVDDSRIVREQVKLALEEAHYEVIEAINGADGLEKTRQHKDAVLLISDLNMPQLNGIDMIRDIRAGINAAIPILVLTTESEGALIQQAKKYGAKGWIVKPFKPELLIAAIRKIAGPA